VGLNKRRKPASIAVKAEAMNAYTMGYKNMNERSWPENLQRATLSRILCGIE
jgi:arginine decarboxylase-like protein